MPVEIREIVLQARVNDDLTAESGSSEETQEELRSLKDEILQECERMIRDALRTRTAR